MTVLVLSSDGVSLDPYKMYEIPDDHAISILGGTYTVTAIIPIGGQVQQINYRRSDGTIGAIVTKSASVISHANALTA